MDYQAMLASFPTDFVELWGKMFEGGDRFKYYIGFCMITFVVPFLLIWLTGGYIEFYFYFFLRKRYPDEWAEMTKQAKQSSTQKHYKEWLKGKVDKVSPFCEIWHMHDIFGKICLGLWAIVIITVGVIALCQ